MDNAMILANLGAERAMLATGQHHRQGDLDLDTFDYLLSQLEQRMEVTELPDPVSTPQPPAHHHGGSDTERIAYEQFAVPKAGTLRREVLETLFIAATGCTDREIALHLDRYLYSVAPRRTELVRMGWVEDSGDRRIVGDNGAPAIVWRLTEAGVHRWAELCEGR